MTYKIKIRPKALKFIEKQDKSINNYFLFLVLFFKFYINILYNFTSYSLYMLLILIFIFYPFYFPLIYIS